MAKSDHYVFSPHSIHDIPIYLLVYVDDIVIPYEASYPLIMHQEGIAIFNLFSSHSITSWSTFQSIKSQNKINMD